VSTRAADYLAFPLRIGPAGAVTADRAHHVRQIVEQVLFTSPGERVFRPDFGAGAKQLVFEPNGGALADLVRKRLGAALAEALRGEVDPRTIEIDVTSEEERILVGVSYQLAALGRKERVVLVAGAATGAGGG
jgi:uncharacterized protein